MPIHRFRCCNKHVTEHIVPLEHNKWQPCGECDKMGYQIPSTCSFRGFTISINDYDDPWEGTSLEGGGEPNTLTYESDKLQLDMGKKTQVGGKSKPVDYAKQIAEARPPR